MLQPFEKTAFLAGLAKGLGRLRHGTIPANLARLGRNMNRGAVASGRTGLALGGTGGALYGAATAEEGHRLEGAARGAAQGAALGGAAGLATGATGAAATMATEKAMRGARALGLGAGARRVAGQVAGQTVGGAGFGGLLGAGQGTLTAEEGHRFEGALKGLGEGAAMGAAGGAVSGGVQGLSQVGRLRAMQQAGATAPQAGRMLRGSWKQNVQGAMNNDLSAQARRANLIEAVAAPAAIAADVGLSTALLPIPGDPTPSAAPNAAPAQIRTAAVAEDKEPFRMEPLYVTPLIGASVRGTVDPILERAMQAHPEGFLARSPKVRKYLLPTAATMALTIPTVKTIRALSPSPADAALKELDLEGLKKDYGREKQATTRGALRA